METRDKPGTSINSPRPLRLDWTTNHGISRAQENRTNSKSGARTQAGGNYSDSKVGSSQTCGIIEFLMSIKVKTQSINKLSSTRDTVERTRNGQFNIWTQSRRFRLRDSLVTSVSMPTDHSTSDQDSQCKEWWSLSEPTILFWRDGERMSLLSNSSLIQLLRPLDLNNGRTTPWKSKVMVEAPI